MKYISIMILFLLVFVKLSFSHKLSTFAYREGSQITGETYFSDGSPCIKCKVEVYDEKGNKILDTVTDEKGKYSFNTKYSGSLKIKVIAGDGHLAETSLEGVKKTSKTEKAISSQENKISKSEISKSSQNKELVSTKIDKDEIKEAVKEAVKEETEGIKNILIEMRKDMDKARLHDIIGGIGYIFGIWGIVVMLRYRNSAK